MISPEVLRRYPLFASLSPRAIQAVAVLADPLTVEDGEAVVEADAPADALFLLQRGAADLSFVLRDERRPERATEHFVSEINCGEPFGISALVEPYVYRGRVRSRGRSQLIRIDAPRLRALCETDTALALALQRGVIRAALERLHATEIQLAAHQA
jgi:CRP-like cAMP-binding protein